MDSETDTVFLNGNCKYGRLICLIAKYKGLSVKPLKDATFSPAIQHRWVTVAGSWACIEYLLDVYPYPELMPETPASRAVMRSLVEALFNEHVTIESFKDLCESRSKKICHNEVTLLDLALIAMAGKDDFVRNAWLTKLNASLKLKLEKAA